MKVVVDSNILFSFFWKDSRTKEIIISNMFDLISSSVALKEIKKYRGDILHKADITGDEFDHIIDEIRNHVKFFEIDDQSVKDAEKFSPDKGDASFLALCLKEKCFLWSNDKKLKEQDEIRVLATKDVIGLFF